ncbi:hypothetical protein V6N11_025134 [Hibiscus sabdariffa]|uniref:Uncharacterized protein n=1 Tax=Hibiscus sabdariffa TaxID=183260 RepID=A0ABR2QP81_9ROSI
MVGLGSEIVPCSNNVVSWARSADLTNGYFKAVDHWGRRGGGSRCRWLVSIAAAIWSIWIAIYDMVFNDKKASVADLLFHSKLRALVWLKASLTGSIGDLEGWWDNQLSTIFSPLLQASARSTISWRLIFSVVGLTSPNLVGCGGVLSSGNGTIRAIFSGYVALSVRVVDFLVALPVTSSVLWILDPSRKDCEGGCVSYQLVSLRIT